MVADQQLPQVEVAVCVQTVNPGIVDAVDLVDAADVAGAIGHGGNGWG